MNSYTTHCHHCNGSEIISERVNLPQGGFHLKLTCGTCKKFIKFKPHSEPTFFFGKHKGATVDEIKKEHPDYLKWLAKNGIVKNARLRRAIEEALEGVR